MNKPKVNQYCEGKMKNNPLGVKQTLKFIFNCTFDNFELQSTFCIMDPRVNIVSKFKNEVKMKLICNNLKKLN